MSKKNNDKFEENKELEAILHVEHKLDTSNLITTETFPISSTVKMTNPGEDFKVSIQNIENMSETIEKSNEHDKIAEDIKIQEEKIEASFNAAVSDVKDKISDVKEKLENKFDDVKKELKKISIIDVSKKKDSHNHENNHSNPLADVIDKVAHFASMSPVHKITEKIDVDAGLEKAFDSLIYLGGGVIAATNITSKALAGVGTYLINRK